MPLPMGPLSGNEQTQRNVSGKVEKAMQELYEKGQAQRQAKAAAAAQAEADAQGRLSVGLHACVFCPLTDSTQHVQLLPRLPKLRQFDKLAFSA